MTKIERFHLVFWISLFLNFSHSTSLVDYLFFHLHSSVFHFSISLTSPLSLTVANTQHISVDLNALQSSAVLLYGWNLNMKKFHSLRFYERDDDDLYGECKKLWQTNDVNELRGNLQVAAEFCGCCFDSHKLQARCSFSCYPKQSIDFYLLSSNWLRLLAVCCCLLSSLDQFKSFVFVVFLSSHIHSSCLSDTRVDLVLKEEAKREVSRVRRCRRRRLSGDKSSRAESSRNRLIEACRHFRDLPLRPSSEAIRCTSSCVNLSTLSRAPSSDKRDNSTNRKFTAKKNWKLIFRSPTSEFQRIVKTLSSSHCMRLSSDWLSSAHPIMQFFFQLSFWALLRSVVVRHNLYMVEARTRCWMTSQRDELNFYFILFSFFFAIFCAVEFTRMPNLIKLYNSLLLSSAWARGCSTHDFTFLVCNWNPRQLFER